MSSIRDLPATAVRLTLPGLRPQLREVLGRDGGYEASDAWYVPWADVDGDGVGDYYRLMDVVAGSTEAIASSAFGSRYIPLRFPVPNQTILATGADSEWLGWDRAATGPAGETGWYQGAIVRIQYKTPRWDTSGTEAMVQIRGQHATYPMLIPAGGLAIGSSVNATPTVRQVGGYTYHVSLRNVAGFDPAVWGPGTSRQGVINAGPWRGLPAGSVKLPGVAFTRTIRWGGTTTDDVEFPLEVRDVPWDQEYDATGSLGTHAMYTAVNLSTLLGFG